MDLHNRKIAILINDRACAGKAKGRWESIRDQVLSKLPKNTIEVRCPDHFEFEELLNKLIIGEHVNGIISGGGDGSLYFLINALFKDPQWKRKNIAVGAIGLGSSNDFHKPVENRIKGIPIKINHNKLLETDVGQVTYFDAEGTSRNCFFLINASFGVTAAGNYFFNHPDWLLKFLKKKWTGGAILYSALKTILNFSNYPARLEYDNIQKEIKLSNLTVLKKRYVSGGLHYDQNITADDGRLGLNYCENMSKWELIKVFNDLGKGRFAGSPKRFSDFITSLRVLSAQTILLEMDGEIVQGKNFSFSLLPKAIPLMTP